MRLIVIGLAGLALAACSSSEPTNLPTEHVHQAGISVSTRVLPVSGGAPSLAVDAWILNRDDSPLVVAVAPDCPLLVSIFPDPTGEQGGGPGTAASMYCSIQGSNVQVAAHDSVLVTHVIAADSLASLAPGLYGVFANISYGADSSTWVMGTFGGTVQFPLAGGH